MRATPRRFRAAFGEQVFDDTALAFKGVLMALETYQQSPAEFYPYSSKYDAWLRHEASLSAQELRGLAAFNDPAKGNCARCHPSAMRKARFRSSRISATRRSARRATRAFPPMRIAATSTWDCAGRCAPT